MKSQQRQTAAAEAPARRARSSPVSTAAAPAARLRASCACGGGCPRCAAPLLPRYPHADRIAGALGLPRFDAESVLDPTVAAQGSRAVTQHGRVRFAQAPTLETAAHEAAHVLQQRARGPHAGEAAAERHAQAVAVRVRLGLPARELARSGLVAAAPQQALHAPAASTYTALAGDTWTTISISVFGVPTYDSAIQKVNPGKLTIAAGDSIALPSNPDPADPWATPELSPLLRKGGPWTQTQSEAALAAFAAAPVSKRDAMVARYLPYNNFGPMLWALPKLSTQAGGANEAAARELLQRIQRVGALADANAQGIATMDKLAQAQATEMIKRNQVAAASALPPGAPPPTTAQVAAQQAGQAAQGSIAPQTAVLTPAQEKSINDRLNKTAIPAFVKWVGSNHPELKITATHLRADARAIFSRGQSIIAFADGNVLRAVVGDAFLQLVSADPAYALPTVVHEVWGHNTYEGQDQYGEPGAALGLDLYDQAAAKMPGYVKPAAGTDDRLSEIDNYGYHETEMYSLMREIAFFKPNAKAHAALAGLNYDPAPEIQNRVQLIHDAYEARVARALCRGLWVRFSADPTVSGDAMNAYRAAVKKVFPAAAAAAIML